MWKWLWVSEIGRVWKSLEVHARESLQCCEWTNEDHFGEGSERKEETCTENLFLIEYLNSLQKSSNVSRIWMMKAMLLRSQKETRNMLLDNEGKTIFVINWQIPGLNCVCALVFCGRLNMWVIKLTILLRKSLSKMLMELPGSSWGIT